MLCSWKERSLIDCVLPRHTFPDENTVWPDSLFQLPVVEEVAGLDVTVNNTEVMNAPQCFEQIKHVFPHFFKGKGIQNVLKNYLDTVIYRIIE